MTFTRSFLLPVATIVLGALVAIFGGAFWLTGVQDRMATEREQQIVAASVAAEIEMIDKLSRDYTVWDDAAINLVTRPSRAWADAQIGEYLFAQYGHEFSYVIDRAGRPIYAVEAGKPTRRGPAETLGSGYARAVREIAAGQHRDVPVAGISDTPAGPIIFSISRIRPDSDGFDFAGAQDRYLVMTNALREDLVAEIRVAAQLPALRWLRTVDHSLGHYHLKTYDGGAAGCLEWSPQHPGTALFRSLIPPLLMLTLAMLGLGIAVLRRARLGVRQLELSESRAMHLANRDSLTGLPNRRAFIRRLVRAARDRTRYVLLYMDLDGFKEVNDTFGHGTGDALLRTTADRLQKIAPAGAYLARLGGDEFAIVIDDEPSDEALDALAAAIVASLREVHDLGGHIVAIGASIGIARSVGLEYEDVVRRADVAMYAAKADGRDGWCIYDESLDDGRRERRELEDDLRKALLDNQIEVAFQPIVRARDGKICTIEALARWHHPQKGNISPDVFIPIAEESGLIIQLGEQVLRAACRAAREWPFKLAVNLSPAQFWDRQLVATVTAILAECDFAAGRLEFEITETYLLRRPEAAEVIIAELQKLGIRIALDDFGTGYASIGYLRRFNLDFVKLDRSFVEGIAEDPEVQDVAMAIIALSRALKLPIVAEGVETEVDARILTVAGCDYLQGWHFGRPVPAAEIARLVGAGHRQGG